MITVAAVEQIWRDLPGYDRENIDEWLTIVLPIIETSRRTSAALTDAYIASALERQPLGLYALERVRNGTDPAEVYQRPFVTVWTALGAGRAWEDAVAQGLRRATSTAAIDTQLAFRSTADHIAQADQGIYGYKRVADAGACAFCRMVNGAYVKSASAFALHNHCGCGLEPLTDPHPAARFLPSGEEIRRDGFAVQTHGELGAVLTDPAHDFTTAALALS